MDVLEKQLTSLDRATQHALDKQVAILNRMVHEQAEKPWAILERTAQQSFDKQIATLSRRNSANLQARLEALERASQKALDAEVVALYRGSQSYFQKPQAVLDRATLETLQRLEASILTQLRRTIDFAIARRPMVGPTHAELAAFVAHVARESSSFETTEEAKRDLDASAEDFAWLDLLAPGQQLRTLLSTLAVIKGLLILASTPGAPLPLTLAMIAEALLRLAHGLADRLERLGGPDGV
jgi:hypothetical protein